MEHMGAAAACRHNQRHPVTIATVKVASNSLPDYVTFTAGEVALAN